MTVVFIIILIKFFIIPFAFIILIAHWFAKKYKQKILKEHPESAMCNFENEDAIRLWEEIREDHNRLAARQKEDDRMYSDIDLEDPFTEMVYDQDHFWNS